MHDEDIECILFDGDDYVDSNIWNLICQIRKKKVVMYYELVESSVNIMPVIPKSFHLSTKYIVQPM